MTYRELITLQLFTCYARNRLSALEEVGVISSEDYVESCRRFSNSWQAAEQYGKAHGIF